MRRRQGICWGVNNREYKWGSCVSQKDQKGRTTLWARSFVKHLNSIYQSEVRFPALNKFGFNVQDKQASARWEGPGNVKMLKTNKASL